MAQLAWELIATYFKSQFWSNSNNRRMLVIDTSRSVDYNAQALLDRALLDRALANQELLP